MGCMLIKWFCEPSKTVLLHSVSHQPKTPPLIRYQRPRIEWVYGCSIWDNIAVRSPPFWFSQSSSLSTTCHTKFWSKVFWQIFVPPAPRVSALWLGFWSDGVFILSSLSRTSLTSHYLPYLPNPYPNPPKPTVRPFLTAAWPLSLPCTHIKHG